MDASEVKAAAERMQTKWDRSSKIVNERGDVRMDYIEDLCILTDAYLSEVEHERNTISAVEVRDVWTRLHYLQSGIHGL